MASTRANADAAPAPKRRRRKTARRAAAKTPDPARKPRRTPAETAFEARIDRKFNDITLLRIALTHASAGGRSYERMEFLGDRVLGLVVAEHLYERYPGAGENDMAPRLSALVSRDACMRAARRIDIGSALRLSPSEARTGGRTKDTILADACEALIAAIYLDGGYRAAEKFILAAWGDDFDSMNVTPRDPKTALQEWAAQRKRPNPRYEVVERTGPDHAPHFVVEARVEGLDAGRGSGNSKRDAEREAARAVLIAVGEHV